MKAYKYVVHSASDSLSKDILDFYDEFEFLDEAKAFASENLDKDPVVAMVEVEINDFGEVVASDNAEEIIWSADLDTLNSEGESDDYLDDDYNLNEPVYEDVDVDEQEQFKYSLLGRLQSDCEYFLGHGGGYEPHLWAKNVKDQISKMRELYNEVKVKPDWITLDDIADYEDKMLAVLAAKESPVDEAIDYNKLREELEEHEDEVECQDCFDLVEKKNAIKTDGGYVCLECQRKRDQAKVANESDDDLDTNNEMLQLMEDTNGSEKLLAEDKTTVTVNIGDRIKIVSMEGEDNYTGLIGEITSIDDAGQLHGTWGGLAVIPGIDEFVILDNFELDEDLDDTSDNILEEPVEESGDANHKAISILSALVQDEWEAITGYSDAIAKLEELNLPEEPEIKEVIKDIVEEENIHVGQLSELIKKYDPSFELKQQEGKEHDNTNFSQVESLKENYEALSFFKKLISKHARNKDFIRRADEDIYYIDEVASGLYSITDLNDDDLAQLEGYVHNIMIEYED